jgi:bifunctional non-homologous end joining protein LigD
MHATQVPHPFHTKGWVYEEKYDGWRMLAVKEAGRVRLVSRNGRDHTKRFNAIAEALTKLKPATFTLDGEVAVFDAELVSASSGFDTSTTETLRLPRCSWCSTFCSWKRKTTGPSP